MLPGSNGEQMVVLENTDLQLLVLVLELDRERLFLASPLTPKFLTIYRAKELHKALCFSLPLPFAFDLHQDVS